MDTKSLGRVAVKDADQGSVTAIFSTLGVVDSDGDVTKDGAFEDGAAVRISAYGHKSWDGALPVGRGTIRVIGDEAVLDGQFFMDMPEARSTFAAVKGLDELQEWSYGYDATEFSFGEHDGQRVRFLQKLKVHEVSPVMLGAGVGTRTLTAKSATPPPAPPVPTGAVDPHTTAVVNEPWDGYEATKDLGPQTRALDLRTVYAWAPPTDSKTSLVLPHHHGIGGAANIRACTMGIALLNNGKSGVPDTDRAAVYEHFAAHLRDAGREPPALRATTEGGDLKVHDELVGGLAGLSALLDTAARVVALRGEKGKDLSGVNAEILGWLSDDLARLKALLPPPPAPDEQPQLQEITMDPALFLASLARIHGL